MTAITGGIIQSSDDAQQPGVLEQTFPGDSEMARRMREFDWSQTALGPVETWSPTLRMMTGFLLANRFPLLLWWGPEFCQLYNDAYIPVLGEKHPDPGLGRPVRECWSEIWHILEPLIRSPFEGGPSTWTEDLPLEVNRFGFLEETHFTVAYSPVPDSTAQGGIGGVLATVHEVTGKIVGERRLLALRDLGARPTGSRTAEEACAELAKALGPHRKDIPFALLYLRNAAGTKAHLAAQTGADERCGLCPESVDLRAGSDAVLPLAECSEQQMVVVDRLGETFGDVPPGLWSDPPDSAAIVPIKSTTANQLAGYLVAGISPRLRFDDAYRGFLELTSTQIASAIGDARAYEEERKRAEALAEIDRAKTTFFTNISHEFRTPLSLLLSPLEETIARAESGGAFGDDEKAHLETARRNAMRLLKLVNTLLDFSRIEAGRANAVYQPTDLARYTAELASIFRSATEKAGLELHIECAPLSQAVSVDREMWEKIVLNLLSNAFKFTVDGSITVRLSEEGEQVHFEVTDTGTGIPEAELPHIFERFHQVKGTRGRSFEGTGIGLALVEELVKLHGGSIRAESESGKGTTIAVTIPKRTSAADLSDAAVELSSSSARLRAENYMQEALHWLPESVESAIAPAGDVTLQSELPFPDMPQARVLLADDNADMRKYLRRLLSRHFEVQTVSNGAEALAAVQADAPDLVLADVMMAELDGFGLLRELRRDAKTRSVPVVLLSARAGLEARVEGLEMGADDYLIKPFTRQELLARVHSQLKLAKLRQEAARSERVLQERLLFAADAAGIGYWFCNLPLDKLIWDARVKEHFWLPADAEVDVNVFYSRIHEEDRERVREAVETSIQKNAPCDVEYRTVSPAGEEKWIHALGHTACDSAGRPVRFDGITRDTTMQRRIEEALRRSEKLAVVGRMASSISHEINNPLEAVMNLLFLIQSTTMEDAARAYTDTALQELARVSHIVTHTLKFNQQRDGGARKKLSELLDTAAAIYTGRMNNSGIRLVKDYGDDTVDEPMALELRQVFSNLIGNAFDATRAGGKIVLRTRRTTEDNGRAAIRVSIADTGHGMDQQTLRRIFEPFFTTKGTNGTGLGLWISADILKRQGARLKVRSRRNEGRSGTVFCIVFPVPVGSPVHVLERGYAREGAAAKAS